MMMHAGRDVRDLQLTWRIAKQRLFDHGAGPADQSRLPSSLTAPIIGWAPADAITRLPQPAIITASLPGFGLRCPDRPRGLVTNTPKSPHMEDLLGTHTVWAQVTLLSPTCASP
jgi:phage terminase large subunit-like protein